ncbi:N-ethylammeline chlorohydrolase [Chromatium okenii]|uniref:TRZ/ATZ family hydrolase n=1 Tax=Chromatium okenii TaxID=61644 RepID=UPI0019080C9D|nr:TRZ/ATZ family hydrolase [Chromatium okenii]MBK1642734.1 N-ethylammeline chlorohydrolase [Chromatium okenii]
MQAELVIYPQWILPVDRDNRQLTNHALAIADGRIVAIVPAAEARQSIHAQQVLELPEHVLIPGLVNAHTHAAMTLLRGLADDLPLMTWLHDYIWPTEQRWVDAEFVRDGTRLAVLEMLCGGVTCYHDMYFHPEVTAQVTADAGMRAVIGMIVVDFPTGYAANADAYLTKGLALHAAYRDHPLIRVAFAPHSPYAVSDAPLQRINALAAQLDVPIHLHLHETHDEIVQSERDHGQRPFQRLDQLGLINSRLLAIHMTQLNDAEIARLAETGAHVVHCPESNLKLASGFCPVEKLLAAGVNVALGTDGAASNNDLNILGEMRTAALLGKGVAGSATAVSATAALRMATINGARALGLADEIGSLEVGKSADIVALDFNDLHTQPVYHPGSQLVYAASRQQVRQVWIRGQQVVRDGVPTSLDSAEVIAAARAWGERIADGQTLAVN